MHDFTVASQNALTKLAETIDADVLKKAVIARLQEPITQNQYLLLDEIIHITTYAAKT